MKNTGLRSKEAEERLKKFGSNKVEQKPAVLIRKFLKWLISPISLMLLAAAALSFFSGRIFDFYFILFLMLLNFFVSFWQEKKADNAIRKLQEHLSVRTRVIRDGQWGMIDSSELVPGDVIELNGGDIVPADVGILEANNLSINEAALTGESLPQEKKSSDKTYSGAFMVTGQAVAEVLATGKNTYFNKTLMSVEHLDKKSILEKDILVIAKFLSLLSLAAVITLTVFFLLKGNNFFEILTLDLSLVIAGVPVSLPTVMTLIISLGVVSLTKKGAVVRRISSLEDLANVDLLFTDKTGTLTRNEISVQKIISYGGSEDEVSFYALMTEIKNEGHPISQAIIGKAKELGNFNRKYRIIDFTPADSKRKRSTAHVETGGKRLVISTGAPQVIEKLCALDAAGKNRLEEDVSRAAKEGYRSLVVAVSEKNAEEKDMRLVGIIFLSDTLHKDSRSVVGFLKDNGVEVRMVTGDHRAIAERVGKELGFSPEQIFSEILPEDKLDLVRDSERNHVVAVTGDGVNDLPAVEAADVGIAVSNAVDALKSSADIVLLSSKIATIKDVIIEARKIFARVYSYSVYRISESFRVIITIAILGLAYNKYPLTPIQLIILALLNDIPIISLAFNRVKVVTKPAKIKVRERFILSSLFGLTGVVNSLLLFLIMTKFLHLGWDEIQTIFFLKLSVSGHLLIYVAHTKERWYRFLPSRGVIAATLGTQLIATFLAFSGIFLSPISIGWIIFVWFWAFFWMQISEAMKYVSRKIVIFSDNAGTN